MDWVAIFVIMCGVFAYGEWPGTVIGPILNVLGSSIWIPWCFKHKQWSMLTITAMMLVLHAVNWWRV